MKTLTLAVAVLLSTTYAFATPAEDTKIKTLISQIDKAKVDVKKGVYVNDYGTKVSKPDYSICEEYKSSSNLFKYTEKLGWPVGSFTHKLMVTRRGC